MNTCTSSSVINSVASFDASKNLIGDILYCVRYSTDRSPVCLFNRVLCNEYQLFTEKRLFMIRLANAPMPHINRRAYSELDMFSVKSNTSNMHRPIPAPEPDPEPNPAPDAGLIALRSSIAPDDWDDLFSAIQTRLEGCVDDGLNKRAEQPTHVRRSLSKAAVLDCVASMRQLHAALAVERQVHQGR